MGWRSWNCYHSGISQAKMTTAADAMVNKSRGASLLEVGYENCGLDDYYQACKTGVEGSFHNASGIRAANSGGPGRPTGPLCTPSRTPWTLST